MRELLKEHFIGLVSLAMFMFCTIIALILLLVDRIGYETAWLLILTIGITFAFTGFLQSVGFFKAEGVLSLVGGSDKKESVAIASGAMALFLICTIVVFAVNHFNTCECPKTGMIGLSPYKFAGGNFDEDRIEVVAKEKKLGNTRIVPVGSVYSIPITKKSSKRIEISVKCFVQANPDQDQEAVQASKPPRKLTLAILNYAFSEQALDVTLREKGPLCD